MHFFRRSAPKEPVTDVELGDLAEEVPQRVLEGENRFQFERLASLRDMEAGLPYANESDLEVEGKLRVRLIQARKLRKRHILAPQHPRASFTMFDWEDKEYKVQTAVHQNGNREAVWDETFTFFHKHTGSGTLVDSMLHLQVHHVPHEGPPELVGEVRLPLCRYVVRDGPTTRQEVIEWHELDGGKSGEVQIGVRFEVDGAKASATAPAAVVGASSAVTVSSAAVATTGAGESVPVMAMQGMTDRQLRVMTSLSEDEFQLFRLYDKDRNGRLDEHEFKIMLRDLALAGGNVKILAGRGNSGCLGRIIHTPREDLISYIQHQHTVLFVFFTHGNDNIQTTMRQRLLLVLMTMLLSVIINCAFELRVGGATIPRFATVVVLDTAGVTFLKQLFFFSHNKRYHMLARGFMQLLFWVLGLVIVASLFMAMDPEQQAEVTVAFLPVWLASRCTELFKVATLWAIKMQYGSNRGCLI